MAHARISANLPPDIDPTKAPLACGWRALPKLNEELQSAELLTQQRALMTLCDLVHDPEKVYQAIEVGFLGNLKTLLRHRDTTVRQKTTEVFYIMATHSIGRQGLLQNGIISALTELLNDPEGICRKNMHQVLEMMAKLPEGYLLRPFGTASFSNSCSVPAGQNIVTTSKLTEGVFRRAHDTQLDWNRFSFTQETASALVVPIHTILHTNEAYRCKLQQMLHVNTCLLLNSIKNQKVGKSTMVGITLRSNISKRSNNLVPRTNGQKKDKNKIDTRISRGWKREKNQQQQKSKNTGKINSKPSLFVKTDDQQNLSVRERVPTMKSDLGNNNCKSSSRKRIIQ